MKVYMLWHGGSSYGAPYDEDAEEFASIADAVDSFESRTCDPYYPCVERDTPENGGPTGLLYIGEIGDCPDRMITFGPRGGVRVERC